MLSLPGKQVIMANDPTHLLIDKKRGDNYNGFKE